MDLGGGESPAGNMSLSQDKGTGVAHKEREKEAAKSMGGFIKLSLFSSSLE